MEFSQLDTTIRDAARRGDLCNLLNAPVSSGESDPESERSNNPTGLAPAILRLATTVRRVAPRALTHAPPLTPTHPLKVDEL